MRNCDTPTTLVHSLLNQIGANNKFSIFTGDLVEAAVWLVNQAFVISFQCIPSKLTAFFYRGVTSDINTFNSELASIPKVKVYPALGNQ